ncbi:MAG: LAGLIDADG family homing endonuclease, partial [Candidatus Caldarchaeum sp.]
NTVVEPQHRMDEETLRKRLAEAGIKIRTQSEAVRRATLRGQRKPPRDTTQMAMAAALVQADAAIRPKGKTMLELILNTPYEAFARTIARQLQEHGTVSLGARKYTEDYYEWQLIVRLDLKDWGFLIDCKKSMKVPEFVKTDEELKAYLAMMTACEGYVTWQATNTGRTDSPTTRFTVVVLTNTNRRLVNTVEDTLKKHGYEPSTVPHVQPGHEHLDQYGRRYAAKLTGYRLSLNQREEVQRFLEWLGPIPHPMKEAYRAWTLRLLREANGMPVRWAKAKSLKDWLDKLNEVSVEMGRKRAKMYFEKVQEEMNSGKRIDRRPIKAQTALSPPAIFNKLSSKEVIVPTSRAEQTGGG